MSTAGSLRRMGDRRMVLTLMTVWLCWISSWTKNMRSIWLFWFIFHFFPMRRMSWSRCQRRMNNSNCRNRKQTKWNIWFYQLDGDRHLASENYPKLLQHYEFEHLKKRKPIFIPFSSDCCMQLSPCFLIWKALRRGKKRKCMDTLGHFSPFLEKQEPYREGRKAAVTRPALSVSLC